VKKLKEEKHAMRNLIKIPSLNDPSVGPLFNMGKLLGLNTDKFI
jgi:hypothetical protein